MTGREMYKSDIIKFKKNTYRWFNNENSCKVLHLTKDFTYVRNREDETRYFKLKVTSSRVKLWEMFPDLASYKEFNKFIIPKKRLLNIKVKENSPLIIMREIKDKTISLGWFDG